MWRCGYWRRKEELEDAEEAAQGGAGQRKMVDGEWLDGGSGRRGYRVRRKGDNPERRDTTIR